MTLHVSMMLVLKIVLFVIFLVWLAVMCFNPDDIRTKKDDMVGGAVFLSISIPMFLWWFNFITFDIHW